MDTATPDKAINLCDYVDISKFNSYGGLTEINIFPKDRKIDCFKVFFLIIIFQIIFDQLMMKKKFIKR